MVPVLEAREIDHWFGEAALRQPVLRSLSVSFAPCAACLLMGPSGSGKTTLLSILGGLLSPSSGELYFQEQRVDFTKRDKVIQWRRDQIGFVFQQAQLLPFLTARENVEIVGRNAGLSRHGLRCRVTELLERLKIAELSLKHPEQLSGGQRQRFAIARALVHRPQIILADEPTAALDWQHGETAVRLLVEQVRLENALLLCVTHDPRLIPYFDRCIAITEGRLVEETQE
jgi:putative ABC transport system ATP-binding protein